MLLHGTFFRNGILCSFVFAFVLRSCQSLGRLGHGEEGPPAVGSAVVVELLSFVERRHGRRGGLDAAFRGGFGKAKHFAHVGSNGMPAAGRGQRSGHQGLEAVGGAVIGGASEFGGFRGDLGVFAVDVPDAVGVVIQIGHLEGFGLFDLKVLFHQNVQDGLFAEFSDPGGQTSLGGEILQPPGRSNHGGVLGLASKTVAAAAAVEALAAGKGLGIRGGIVFVATLDKVSRLHELEGFEEVSSNAVVFLVGIPGGSEFVGGVIVLVQGGAGRHGLVESDFLLDDVGLNRLVIAVEAAAVAIAAVVVFQSAINVGGGKGFSRCEGFLDGRVGLRFHAAAHVVFVLVQRRFAFFCGSYERGDGNAGGGMDFG